MNSSHQFDTLLAYGTLFQHFDTDASLTALHGLKRIMEGWRRELIDEIEPTRIGQFVDGDLAHESVYRDVAISHAAAGCIAPFIEGTLAHGFFHLERNYVVPEAARSHPRWRCNEVDFWKFRRVMRKQEKPSKGIVDGFLDLLAALDVSRFFPLGGEKVMNALFSYRNLAFHNGFEWPIHERVKFKERSAIEGWDSYIIWSSINQQPWIATLAPAFINECASLCEDFVKGFEAVRVHWAKSGWDRPFEPRPPSWLDGLVK